jgi:prolyl 3-hydroxylase /prolyl 3,4-dihydroxylase
MSTDQYQIKEKKKMSLLTTEDAPLESLKSLRETYANAKPFPHIVLNSSEAPFPMDLDFLRKLRTSLQTNTPVTYKETDLFKLYQTKDLSDSEDPAIAALASTLYKDSFRSYVSKLTSCPELTSRVDMAASAYASGCHLLCHDDVIGTRAVSFVLYLSEEDWDGKRDGGNLELYSSPHEPVPAKKVPPTFGTLVLFEVKPGVSFHAVQEVFRDGSPRLSVQGWFHAKSPPKGFDVTSTLSDLTRRTCVLMLECENNIFDVTILQLYTYIQVQTH